MIPVDGEFRTTTCYTIVKSVMSVTVIFSIQIGWRKVKDTLCSERISEFIKGWHISDKSSFSDHRCIGFRIKTDEQLPHFSNS